MKRYIFAILLLGLAGCMSGASDQELVRKSVECAGECSAVEYSSPDGKDLQLETDRHVIRITGEPDTQYAYYVWTGNKTYGDEPDIIIE